MAQRHSTAQTTVQQICGRVTLGLAGSNDYKLSRQPTEDLPVLSTALDVSVSLNSLKSGGVFSVVKDRGTLSEACDKDKLSFSSLISLGSAGRGISQSFNEELRHSVDGGKPNLASTTKHKAVRGLECDAR